jgi:hypothetical protein
MVLPDRVQHTICANISILVIVMLEFPQGLYDIDVLLRPGNHEF